MLTVDSGRYPLSKDSHELTTFIIPYRHYSYNKLPLGFSSAPEHLQKRMNTILDGLGGVLCLMNDIFEKNQKEPDARLTVALERIQAAHEVTVVP